MGLRFEILSQKEACYIPFLFDLQDIRHAFPEIGIVSVTIETNDGRYKASARLSMEYPEVLDDWPDSRQTVFVKNKEVSVCVGNSGMVTNTNDFLFLVNGVRDQVEQHVTVFLFLYYDRNMLTRQS